MVNEKLVFEIGKMIRVLNKGSWKFPFYKKLTAEEIIESWEYKKEFKPKFPELCKLAEENYSIQEEMEGNK